jgi:putative lipoic acid-binding regulatory protein
LKDNIKKLENVLQTTKRVEGVKFVWDDEHFKIKNKKSILFQSAFKGDAIGFIAQQLEDVVPEVVFTDDDGYKSVQYGLMVSLGIGSVQEQQKRINSIYERINILKEKISG